MRTAGGRGGGRDTGQGGGRGALPEGAEKAEHGEARDGVDAEGDDADGDDHEVEYAAGARGLFVCGATNFVPVREGGRR
jgi:hypothetical protein